MAERLLWADAVKGIGIILVVFGHVWRGLSESELIADKAIFHAVDGAVYLFHMPLFFLISGLFFEKAARRDGFSTSLTKRAEALLFPLVLWSWVTAAFLLIAGALTNRPPISAVDAMLYPFPPKDIFWFLWALFVIQTAASLLVNARWPYVTVAFVISLGLLLIFGMTPFPYLLQRVVENLPFFLAGVLLSRWGKFPVAFGHILGPPGLAVFIVCVTWGALNWSLVDTALGYLIGLIAVTSFCIAIAWIVEIVPRRITWLLSSIGVASIAIYVSHVIPLAAVRIILTKLGVESPTAHLAAGIFLGVVPGLIGYYLLKRWGFLRWFGLGRDEAHHQLHAAIAHPKPPHSSGSAL